jgi:hypothetical protein
MLLDPSAAPTLPPSIGSASRSKTELGNNNVINGDEEASVGKCSHKETIAIALCSRTSADQIWTASPRRWENKPKALTEKPPRQHGYNIVKKEENDRSAKDLPEPSVATVSPDHSPALEALHIQATAFRELPDEPRPPIETVPRRLSQYNVKAKRSRDEYSPKPKLLKSSLKIKRLRQKESKACILPELRHMSKSV